MKKTVKSICVMLIAIGTSNLLSSCATLFTKSTTPIVLVSPPADLKITENGVELLIEQVFASAKNKGRDVTVLYYGSGVNVSKKQKHHTLVLESGGKKAEVKRRTKVNGGILFLDIIFTGGLGCTRPWNPRKPNRPRRKRNSSRVTCQIVRRWHRNVSRFLAVTKGPMSHG